MGILYGIILSHYKDLVSPNVRLVFLTQAMLIISINLRGLSKPFKNQLPEKQDTPVDG